MRWTLLRPGQGQGLLSCLEPVDSLVGFDPMLVWTDVTQLRGRPDAGRQLFPVSFEARRDAHGHVLLPAAASIMLNPGTLSVGLAANGSFFTGFARAAALPALATQVARFRVGLLPWPVLAASPGALPLPAPLGPPRRPVATEPVVIGFIDHGFGFANRQFASFRAGRWASRIERVWDQQSGLPGTPVSGPWRAPAGFCYGRELVNLDPSVGDAGARRFIDALMNSQADEAALYRQAGYRPAQGARAHGAHVMGVAAGKTRYAGSRPAQHMDDAAAHAPIIAVQLPHLPEKDTSGQSLHVHLLDAVCYLLHHAAGRKLVINLSDGAYAGPHDGQSLLERALSALMPARARDRLLVVAAGNQFDERVHWADRLPPMGSRDLNWRLLPDDKTDSHMEIWLEPGLSLAALRAIEVRLTPPGAGASIPVKLGQTVVCSGDGRHDPVLASLAFAARTPNSPGDRCMIHVAVRPTLAPRGQPAHGVPGHGVWQLSLANRGEGSIGFDAWIERDNPALGDRGPRRQSHFIHPAYPRDNRLRQPALDDRDNSSPIRRGGALNIVATAANLVVAGAHVASTGRLARYSASGPGRAGAVAGVDLLAAGEASEVLHGIRAAGVRSGTTFRMDGTSVAAPAVTRVAARLMAQNPEVTDLQRALRRLALPDVAGPVERVGAGRLPF